jgi:hypothetical protein
VLVVAVAGMLVGLLVGVVLGTRLDDGDEGAAASGSSSDPVALGDEHALGGGWSLRVTSVDPDAGEQIADLREANEPPGPNESYVLVTVELTYAPSSNGPVANADPQSVLAWLLDDDGVEYFSFQHSCGAFPNAIYTYGPLEPGQMIEANHCWAVPTDRLEQMRLVAASPAGRTDQHFALR